MINNEKGISKMNRLLTICLVLLGLVSVSYAATTVAKTSTSQAPGCYFGIFREGSPSNMGNVDQIEEKLGKKFSMVMWYQDWDCKFPKAEIEKIHKRGAVPHIVWEPWYWANRDKNLMDDIISGKQDAYIKSWAKGIKESNGTVFIRYAHEFNIDGYPWGIVHNGKNPKKYIDAYRHVYDIFTKEGAKNAKFVWCPMAQSWPQEPWNDMNLAYPGDKYVDWIGLDGYNWGTSQDWSSWQSFTELFRDVAREMWRKYPTKPIMVAEFASATKGGDKAKWIKDLTNELKKMPYIKAVLWFDEKKETDWRIESTSSTLAGFKTMIKDPYFASSSKGIEIIGTSAMDLSNKKNTKAIMVSTAPKIDGVLNDWKKTSPIIIDKLSQVQEGSTVWKNKDNLSGQLFVNWDKNNLYVAGDIIDNVPVLNPNKKSNIWKGDAIEIVIGLDKSAKSDRAFTTKGDFQIGFATGDNKKQAPSIWVWKNNESPAGSKIVVKKSANGKGYTIEASIPWKSLNGFTPSAGDKLSFDVALDDADVAGKDRTVQMVWSGDYLFYKDPGVWGSIEFVK